jgi:hypothetical protein
VLVILVDPILVEEQIYGVEKQAPAGAYETVA